MTGIDENGQVALLFEDWDGAQIQCEAGHGLEGADAAFTQDHIRIPFT